MITKKQVTDLSQYYHIDEFTVIREYLQLVFLNYLYQQKEAGKIRFKGGTAIHLLFDSPRFSEDLDFSTNYSKSKIKTIVKQVEKAIGNELPSLKVLPLYSGKKALRFRLKYESPDFKYPLVVRLDFAEGEPEQTVVSPVVSKFPLVFFPLISHLAAEEMLAEKVRALTVRGKGRDIFDLWFLLEKGVEVNASLVEKKMKEVGKKFDKVRLLKKIENYPQKNLKVDLDRFLPVPQRKITGVLRELLLEKIDKIKF